MTYGTIIVAARNARKDREYNPMTLTFTDEETYSKALAKFRMDNRFTVCDAFYGYKVFNDVNDAMHEAEIAFDLR